ncbi:hypothetical protein AAFF_G00069850 [Aldrovandia affinis]|uniref:Uncharacterized protein n=1 Tax=Aldrovandia affinis TaxID=143900 RepID=A0AAD7VXR1_9TELE|nr:hypothetical protein AAFF_G00069850 [Aldrovandia affinis]
MIFVRRAYNETVTVRTPSLIIRGEDRNETILDGEFELEMDSTLSPMLSQSRTHRAELHEVNGFYWTGVTGYTSFVSRLTNMGDYGIYAFDAVDEAYFEYVFASGNRDSGIYIRAVLSLQRCGDGLRFRGERAGLLETNAGGELYLINSYLRRQHGRRCAELARW